MTISMRGNMLNIINQETHSKHGNDCLIEDCYTLLECHDKYIVMNFRRYRGWCDDGIDIRGKKEFDNIYDATEYYNKDLRWI
jgi:hypothetical protein